MPWGYILFNITSRVVNQISIRWRFKKNEMTARTRYNVVSFIHCVCIYLCILCWTLLLCCVYRGVYTEIGAATAAKKGGNEYKSIWTKYHERKGETVKFRSKKSRGCISSLCRRVQYYTLCCTRLSWYGKIYKRRSAAAAGLSTAACHWWFMTPSTPHTHFLGLLLLLYIYLCII